VSCHHPSSHKIQNIELKKSFKAIHNTEVKKKARKEMLVGERPSECDYCWKIEDISPENISDRVFKSNIYTKEEIEEAEKSLWDKDINLKTVKLVFNRNCNFACAYCNSEFSTKWAI
jgi:hypothetical protein